MLKVKKGHDNNHLDTFSKVKSKSLTHSVLCPPQNCDPINRVTFLGSIMTSFESSNIWGGLFHSSETNTKSIGLDKVSGLQSLEQRVKLLER